MKSEERHQLQHNELADWLTKLSARVKPYIPHLAAGVVLVFIGMWIIGLISASREAKRGEAWKDLFGAQNPEQLEVVVERYKGSEIVPYARLKAGQFYFSEGKSRLFSDRTEALAKLDKAVKEFEAVATASTKGSMLRSQALLGIAVSKETTGAVTEALEAYKRLADDGKGTTEGSFAERQIKNLESPEAKDFYTKVKNYQPKTPSTDLPPKDWQSPGVPFTLPESMTPKKANAKPAEKPSKSTPPQDSKPAGKSSEKSGEKPAEKSKKS